ncbi:Cytoplasmic tRNA 2-thiolation 2 [Lecanosticta acicola]|uniref:Cytoplasmic tRNA 2-thiolation protein 2 n=1 Tax=Lecanosticta acicola TaxID=111012 RepID=A0AAI8Z2B1_9PEZI|nr:Cytoplasmic tRNA 2-thiolation 2 [Lecanosticta acicola]
MPGQRVQTSTPLDESLCRRCQETVPSINVRTEPLCKACFAKYVQSKVVKRMESFRVRHSEPGKERKLLLPFSPDASSVALLHILSQQLRLQSERTGRTGFKLCVMHVLHEHDTEARARRAFAAIKARYPEHAYQSTFLSQVLAADDVSSLFPDLPPNESLQSADTHHLQAILRSTRSATARQDLEEILRRRLIVQCAKEQDCEAVVWEYSTTKLAERTLAETAKGRGFSIPWAVSDGESRLGIPFYYPMRELLRKEIEAYVSFLDPPFDHTLLQATVKPAVSTRNTTIDDLMGQYFDSVERDYPSIVANVVRTAGKLRSSTLSEVEQQCELCNMPLEGRAPERSRLCYGCIRNMPRRD